MLNFGGSAARISPVRSRRKAIVSFETLETRQVLSTTHVAPIALFNHPGEVRTAVVEAKAAAKTISGRVLDEITNRGVARVRLQLIDAAGTVVKTTLTNARGNYSFRILIPGPYVVREVVPRGFRQVTPSFVHEEPEGTYAPGFGGNSWNYETGNSNPAFGPVGAPFWDSITTAHGGFESPINITGPTIDLSSVLAVNYAAATPSKIVNNGHQLQVQFPSTSTADTILLAGELYTLSQFHYHDPSENQVNGLSYNMELHFVNSSASGAETVLAVFLQLGAHNNALDSILDTAAASLTQAGSSVTPTTPIDFSGLLPANKQGWFFEGSLTAPPLSGPLNWIVFATPISLDFAQLRKYEAVAASGGFLPNNRPIQPTNGRRMNEFNHNLIFTGLSITGVDFTLTRRLSTVSFASAKFPSAYTVA